MNTKLHLCATLAFVLTGCAGNLMQPVAMNSDARANFVQAESIAVTMQSTPGFMFTTPAGALVSAGMAKWKDPSRAPSWSSITTVHDVPDFTDTVKTKFLSNIASDIMVLEIETLEARQPYSTKEETAYVEQISADYVLEIRTQFGSFGYKPLAWKTYVMNYSGQARIIRTSDQAVVWKASCIVKASESPVLEIPGDDFLEQDGEQFRQAAAYVTDSCARQLHNNFRQG